MTVNDCVAWVGYALAAWATGWTFGYQLQAIKRFFDQI